MVDEIDRRRLTYFLKYIILLTNDQKPSFNRARFGPMTEPSTIIDYIVKDTPVKDKLKKGTALKYAEMCVIQS